MRGAHAKCWTFTVTMGFEHESPCATMKAEDLKQRATSNQQR